MLSVASSQSTENARAVSRQLGPEYQKPEAVTELHAGVSSVRSILRSSNVKHDGPFRLPLGWIQVCPGMGSFHCSRRASINSVRLRRLLARDAAPGAQSRAKALLHILDFFPSVVPTAACLSARAQFLLSLG